MVVDPIKLATETSKSVKLWLECMAEGVAPGRFRFCSKGSLVPTRGKRGQVTTCFAAKIAWHVGGWHAWPVERKKGCTNFIKSFQLRDGAFKDRWLLHRIDWTTRLVNVKKCRPHLALGSFEIEKTRAVRAETRQSAATLILLEEEPEQLLPNDWGSVSSVIEFITSLDWTRPWGAGSHASHLIAFTAINGKKHGDRNNLNVLLDAAFEETDKYIEEATGVWGIGDLDAEQRINGAMKMLTAYHWAERPIPHPERLIDYALGNASGQDGCGVLDRLYVLHRASKEVPGYRRHDLEKFALVALEEISGYLQRDGAFSFYQDRAQRTYYGALISFGGRQSDMHGTVLFTWAMSIALDMLGLRDECGWRISSP